MKTITKEEAITIIDNLHLIGCGRNQHEDDLKINVAIDMAIEALTEPINCVKCKHYYETEDDVGVHGHCRMDTAHTDLISRADVIETVKFEIIPYKRYHKGEWLLLLSKREVLEVINALPSTGRPHGVWIDSRDTDTPWNDGFKCSACNKNSLIRYNYCPNCGTEMKGEEE